MKKPWRKYRSSLKKQKKWKNSSNSRKGGLKITDFQPSLILKLKYRREGRLELGWKKKTAHSVRWTEKMQEIQY